MSPELKMNLYKLQLLIAVVMIACAITLKPLDWRNAFIAVVGAFCAIESWVKLRFR